MLVMLAMNLTYQPHTKQQAYAVCHGLLLLFKSTVLLQFALQNCCQDQVRPGELN